MMISFVTCGYSNRSTRTSDTQTKSLAGKDGYNGVIVLPAVVVKHSNYLSEITAGVPLRSKNLMGTEVGGGL